MKAVQPPLRYPGSKFRAFKYIKPYVDFVEHDEYREPFLGSGAVFFQKDKVKYNWLNDYDKDLMNFYQVIQNIELCSKMGDEVSTVLPTKEWFTDIKNSNPNDAYDRAKRYFLINRTAYSGIMNLPNWGFHKTKSVQPDKWANRLNVASQKLQNVMLSNCDYEQLIIAPSKGESTLIFLDPPYFAADQKRAYVKSFDYDDHVRLSEILKKCKHKFILTYDDCDEVRKLYSWAHIHPIEFMYNTANSVVTTRKIGKELIITNFII